MSAEAEKIILPSQPNPARQELTREFLQKCPGFSQAEMFPLAGDASFRRYIRVKQDGRTAMLMDAPPEKEDVRKYLVIAEYLHGHGYSTPAILASDIAAGFILLEDFGNDLFTSVLKGMEGAAREEQERVLYEAAIDVLAEWYDKQHILVDPDLLTLSTYGDQLLLREVSLFAEWFLPQVLGREAAAGLYDEYMGLWESVLPKANLATEYFVHRDYHADNLMWLPDRQGVKRVGLLDFQDGVYGDPAYDVVSLLEDARRDVPDALVQHLMLGYLYATKMHKDRFMTSYAVLGAQRNSKIVGIFVRLAARDNKHAYLEYLPRVWQHLERDLQHPLLRPVKEWLDKHVSAEWRGVIPVRFSARDLTKVT